MCPRGNPSHPATQVLVNQVCAAGREEPRVAIVNSAALHSDRAAFNATRSNTLRSRGNVQLQVRALCVATDRLARAREQAACVHVEPRTPNRGIRRSQRNTHQAVYGRQAPQCRNSPRYRAPARRSGTPGLRSGEATERHSAVPWIVLADGARSTPRQPLSVNSVSARTVAK